MACVKDLSAALPAQTIVVEVMIEEPQEIVVVVDENQAQTEIVVIIVVDENQAQIGTIVVTVVPRVMTVVETVLVTEMEAGILEAEATRRFVLETNLQADFIAKIHLGEIVVEDRQILHAMTLRTNEWTFGGLHS